MGTREGILTFLKSALCILAWACLISVLAGQAHIVVPVSCAMFILGVACFVAYASIASAKDRQSFVATPFKVGDTVYVRGVAVSSSETDGGNIYKVCSLDSECVYKDCEEADITIFETQVEALFDEGNGIHYCLKGVDKPISVDEVGSLLLFTKEEAASSKLKAER